MALFRVTEILSGNKIKVQGWVWAERNGTDVIIAGYNPMQGNPHMSSLNEDLAKNRLTSLILGKDIELGRVVDFNENTGAINCVAYYNGVDIAKYFPEYTQTSQV